MTLEVNIVDQPNVGFEVKPYDLRITASAAIVAGDCIELPTDSNGKFGASTAAVSVAGGGNAGVPAANLVQDGIFAIALENIALGAQGRVRLKGLVTATITSTAGFAADAFLMPNTANLLLVSIVNIIGDANKKYVAKVLALEGGAVTAVPRQVMFDGINGFGRSGGAT